MAELIRTIGFEAAFSNDQVFQLARDENKKQAEYDFEVGGQKLTLNFESGEFSIHPAKDKTIGLIRLERKDFEIDMSKMSTSDVSPLGCKVSGSGWCNCGSGWVCAPL